MLAKTTEYIQTPQFSHLFPMIVTVVVEVEEAMDTNTLSPPLLLAGRFGRMANLSTLILIKTPIPPTLGKQPKKAGSSKTTLGR